MNVRHLAIIASAFALANLEVQTTATAIPTKPAAPAALAMDWHDVTKWSVEGRAWPEMEGQTEDRFHA